MVALAVAIVSHRASCPPSMIGDSGARYEVLALRTRETLRLEYSKVVSANKLTLELRITPRSKTYRSCHNQTRIVASCFACRNLCSRCIPPLWNYLAGSKSTRPWDTQLARCTGTRCEPPYMGAFLMDSHHRTIDWQSNVQHLVLVNGRR